MAQLWSPKENLVRCNCLVWTVSTSQSLKVLLLVYRSGDQSEGWKETSTLLYVLVGTY